MNEVTYRTAVREDVVPAMQLFWEALQDLLKRNGLPEIPLTFESRLPWYSHIFDTGFFHVAEQGGKIVALANGIVRDEQWFLSGFWVKPGLQKCGIGGPLLRRVWGNHRSHFTWSSIDFAAVASYFKLGMLPICQLFALAAPAKELKISDARDLHAEPLADLAQIAELDHELRGVSRLVDLAYFLREGARGYRVAGGHGGYFFVKDGAIGPVGWSRPEDGEAVMQLALKEAAADAKEVRISFAGVNHTALKASLAAGLRLTGSAHLLALGPIGDLGRYVPSGGLLF